MTKQQLKNICKQKEITRQDARLLLRLLFDDSYYILHEKTQIHPMYLREMLCFIKPFTMTAQVAIVKASLELLDTKPVKVKKIKAS